MFLPSKQRFFFEGSTEVRGQLWYQERRLVYRTILERKPETVFEVGTWEGGGSTLFIAQALHDADGGVLHTIEADPSRHQMAEAGFSDHLPHLKPFVRFHLGNSVEVYPKLLSSLGTVDAVFLDGAQDPDQAVAELEMFKPYLMKGSVLMMHDWDNDKMNKVRQLIEKCEEWRITTVLTHPHSLGFAVAIKNR